MSLNDVESTFPSSFMQIYQSFGSTTIANKYATGSVGLYGTISTSSYVQPILKAYPTAGVVIENDVSSNTTTPILSVRQTNNATSTYKAINMYINAVQGYYNPFAVTGDNMIYAYNGTKDTQNLVVTTDSNTLAGIRITPTSTTLGHGTSSYGVPLTSFSCDGTNATITCPSAGFININGNTTISANNNIVLSSGTGYIQFPDGTQQTTAATSQMPTILTFPYTISATTAIIESVNMPTFILSAGTWLITLAYAIETTSLNYYITGVGCGIATTPLGVSNTSILLHFPIQADIATNSTQDVVTTVVPIQSNNTQLYLFFQVNTNPLSQSWTTSSSIANTNVVTCVKLSTSTS